MLAASTEKVESVLRRAVRGGVRGPIGTKDPVTDQVSFSNQGSWWNIIERRRSLEALGRPRAGGET